MYSRGFCTHHDAREQTHALPTVGMRHHVSIADGQEGDRDEPHGAQEVAGHFLLVMVPGVGDRRGLVIHATLTTTGAGRDGGTMPSSSPRSFQPLPSLKPTLHPATSALPSPVTVPRMAQRHRLDTRKHFPQHSQQGAPRNEGWERQRPAKVRRGGGRVPEAWVWAGP